MTRRLLTFQETADKLAVSLDWLYRNHKALSADQGFPTPVKGLKNRFDEKAIDLWLDEQMPPELRPETRITSDEPKIVLDLGDDIGERLQENARAIAAGQR